MKSSPFRYLAGDLSAGLVVFLVALPLCLGIALGSNPAGTTTLVPAFSGLIAGICGGIIVGGFSGSQLSVSGPAAGLTTIVAASLTKLPSFEAFLLGVFVAGLLQLLMGYARLGVIGNYVPTAVIRGMLTAIGLILILKQIPHLIGYDKDFEGDETFLQNEGSNTFSAIELAFLRITPLAALIGILGILIQIVWEKGIVPRVAFLKVIPAPLLVVVTGVTLNMTATRLGFNTGLQHEHMVNIPVAESFSQFTGFFSRPDFGTFFNPRVWGAAFTIALVASLETLLNIEASDALDPLHRITPTNRELKAQGIGNAVSGLLGGLPVTSVVVRTSANINSGARTKIATITHGVLLLACVAFLAHYLNYIPLSALAAVLIYTGYKLAKPSLFRAMYKAGWDQFIPFMVTVAAIILTDLLIGIFIGMIIGLFYVLRSNFHSAVILVKQEERVLLRLRKDVSYLNKPIVRRQLASLPDGTSILIDVSQADYIDKDVIYVINDFIANAPDRNIRVEVHKLAFKKRQELVGQEIYGHGAH